MGTDRQYEVFSEIIKSEYKREIKMFSKYACRSSECIRLYDEPIPDRKNVRPAFFHDADRIIHSKAYTRYIDKTQVFSFFDNDHITHRVLHVQLVSKIARMIGRCLKLNEDLIEAIALAHDLGHVPYGHDGERYLDSICKEKNMGCFCHNAQSVKFLMELEKNGEGLNLSLQVLDGVLAHNGEILQDRYEPARGKTFDQFLEEYNKCFSEKGYSSKIVPMTFEGCVVRISDIIAYIGRDVEDAITLKIIDRSEIPSEVKEVLGDTNSSIINSLITDIIVNSYGVPYLAISPRIFSAMHRLLEFNYTRIYKNPSIKDEDEKLKNMFRVVYDRFYEQLVSGNSECEIFSDYLSSYKPEYFNKYRENNMQGRVVIDYISGMTDRYFNDCFTKFIMPKKFGKNILS